MTIVPVSLGERSYDVRIEPGLLDRAGEALKPYAGKRSFVVVMDENVAAKQWPRLSASLAAAGLGAEPIVLPAGESTKSWAQLEALTDRFIELGVERRDHVIALGGGVIGDLVGFAASIVKRGCHFVQVIRVKRVNQVILLLGNGRSAHAGVSRRVPVVIVRVRVGHVAVILVLWQNRDARDWTLAGVKPPNAGND